MRMPRVARSRPPAPRTPVASPPTNPSNTLVHRLTPGQTVAALVAETMVSGLAMNAVTAVGFSTHLGTLDLTACVAALTTTTERVKHGDLGEAEALLAAQSVTLNAIFTELSRRALSNMGQYLDAADRYMRLALKAQSQCRATVETLALMKNPPTVFARQHNIAHGPQQVNNGMPMPPTRAGDLKCQPTKLLEETHARMDPGTTSEAGRSDQTLAPLGPVHRPAKR